MEVTKIVFNGAKADYTSPEYLARVKKREEEAEALKRCKRLTPERLALRTHRPK